MPARCCPAHRCARPPRPGRCGRPALCRLRPTTLLAPSRRRRHADLHNVLRPPAAIGALCPLRQARPTADASRERRDPLRALARGGTVRACDPADTARSPPRIPTHIGGVPIGSCCYLHPQERCSVCGFGRVVRPWAAGAKATCAACAVEEHPACVHCGLDAPIPPPGAAACCSRCAEGRAAACVDCGTLTVMSGRNRQTRCSRCYRRPERRCGRCGRLGAIARLATGDDPDLCRNCWTGPVMACEACGGVRPCRGERNGTMLSAGCRPRPKRPCAYCGNRRTVTIVWAGGPACSSCYRAFCPGQRRLPPLRSAPPAPALQRLRRVTLCRLRRGCAGPDL